MNKSGKQADQPGPLSCPDRSVLEAMLLGELSPELTEGLAAHVERCPSCEETVESLGDSKDDLIEDLGKLLASDFSRVRQELMEQESFSETMVRNLLGTDAGRRHHMPILSS